MMDEASDVGCGDVGMCWVDGERGKGWEKIEQLEENPTRIRLDKDKCEKE